MTEVKTQVVAHMNIEMLIEPHLNWLMKLNGRICGCNMIVVVEYANNISNMFSSSHFELHLTFSSYFHIHINTIVSTDQNCYD
jgi:hypothetical protein